jgi:hypothetical protein
MRMRWPLLWLVLAAACGTVLFHTSQRVTDTREKIAALSADTVKEQDSIRVLNAEWSYLNAPARLEKLARAHLALEPMKGRQFVSAAALDAALQPAAGDAAPQKDKPKEQTAARADTDDGDIAPQEQPPLVKAPEKKADAKKKPEPKKTAEKKKQKARPHSGYVYSPPHVYSPSHTAAPRRNFGGLMQRLGVR